MLIPLFEEAEKCEATQLSAQIISASATCLDKVDKCSKEDPFCLLLQADVDVEEVLASHFS